MTYHIVYYNVQAKIYCLEKPEAMIILVHAVSHSVNVQRKL